MKTANSSMNTRPLGCWETLHALIHDKVHGHGIIVGVVSIASALNPDIIKQALQLLHQKHPLLQASIREQGDTLHFDLNIPFEQIPYQVIKKSHDNAWQEVFEHAVSTALPRAGYLWRFYLLCPTADTANNTELILAAHHSICDGMAGAYFLNDLLQYYCDLVRGVLPAIKELPFTGSVDDFLKKHDKKGSSFLLEAPPKLTQWTFLQDSPIEQRKTKMICKVFGGEALIELEHKCKHNRVSIHAALNAAMIISASQIQGNDISIALQTPINLRPYCRGNIPKEQFSCFASIATSFYFDIDANKDFWSLAREYRQNLKFAIKNKRFYPPQFDRSTLAAMVDSLLLEPRHTFSLGFGVSHMGRLKFLQRHNINFLYACPARQGADFVILLCTSIINDTLFLAFCYTDPALDAAWVEEFSEIFIEKLLAV